MLDVRRRAVHPNRSRIAPPRTRPRRATRSATLARMPSGLHHVREDRSPGAPPLLLLAGIGSSSAAWRPVVPLLASERDVWRLDLPGFGRSEGLPTGAPCGIDALADAAERFLDEVGLELPHVAGNSLGGGR